jgi:transcriptional regulator with XRE-family HTH domain
MGGRFLSEPTRASKSEPERTVPTLDHRAAPRVKLSVVSINPAASEPLATAADEPRPEPSTSTARSQPEWREWMRDLGRQIRRGREFLGLSQEQLARLAGVSQGAVSRLETARGLATPTLVVLRVSRVLAGELGKVQPGVIDADLRSMRSVLRPSDEVIARAQTVNADPHLEELMEIYRQMAPARRPAMLAILRAAVAALK